MEKRLEPGLQARRAGLLVGLVAEGLEVSAGALAEAAGEVVRAGALAPEHPAVGVEQERDRPVEDLTFEDAEAVGAGLVARDPDGPGPGDLAGGDGLGVLRGRAARPRGSRASPAASDRARHEGRGSPGRARRAGSGRGDYAWLRRSLGRDLRERLRRIRPEAGGDLSPGASPGSTGGASWARAEPPVQSLAVQPERPSINRISPIRTDQKLGSPSPSR